MSRLTPYKVDNLRPRETQFEVFDEGRPLAIRVGKSGTKTWTMFYRTPDGRQRRLTVGRYPEVSVADARRLCEEHLKTLASGIDPADQLASEHTRRRQAPTVADLAAAYLERYAKRNKKSWKTDEAYFRVRILPALGDRKAADVKRRDVVELVEGIAEDAPVTANRAFATLRGMYSWAIRVDLVETSPCDRVQRPSKEQPRDRVLTDEEIRTVWTTLESVRPAGGTRSKNDLPMTEGTALALKFALVTAQRIGEVCGMHWAEVDRGGGWWILPAARSKNGREHRVPLCRLAFEILTRAAAIGGGSGWIFPGKGGLDSIQAGACAMAVRRVRQQQSLRHFTPHDLRRTAATRMASAGVPRVVVGKVLNHAERGITAVYDRAGYDREKREALETWETELRQIVGLEAAEGGQR